MLNPRMIVFLFAFALASTGVFADASAQLIHTTIVAHHAVCADSTLLDGPNTQSTALSAPHVAIDVESAGVISHSGGSAGIVVTNAWPNPLHNASTLHLEVMSDKEAPITAGIYGLDGAQKATLDLGQLTIGSNELQAAVPELPSGEYLIRLQQGSDKPEIVRINYIK